VRNGGRERCGTYWKSPGAREEGVGEIGRDSFARGTGDDREWSEEERVPVLSFAPAYRVNEGGDVTTAAGIRNAFAELWSFRGI
jgi:hypothetical protein